MHTPAALGLALLLTQTGPLIYEAQGPQAPQRERFEWQAERLLWKADDGQLRAVFDLRSRQLLQAVEGAIGGPLRDEDLRARAAVVEEAARRLREDLQPLSGHALQTARARLDEQFRLRGPWAPLEVATAADARTPLPGKAEVSGRACQRVRLHAEGRPVATACTVPATEFPGGPEVLALLQAVAAAEDALRQKLPESTWPLRLPQHPLVTAARDGRLPVEVTLQLAGEPVQAWRLRSPESAPTATLTPTP